MEQWERIYQAWTKPQPVERIKPSLFQRVRCWLGGHLTVTRASGLREGPDDTLYVSECVYCDHKEWD